MRISNLRVLADHVFGPALARTYAGETSLTVLGGLTADEALESGIPPRDVWVALCDEMEVPEKERWEIPGGKKAVRGARHAGRA